MMRLCLLLFALTFIGAACCSTPAKGQDDLKVVCELCIDGGSLDWVLDAGFFNRKYHKYFFLPLNKTPEEACAQWVTLYETKDAFVFEFVARTDIRKLMEKLDYPLVYQIHFRGAYNYACNLNIFSIHAMRHALAVEGDRLVYYIDKRGRIHLRESNISMLEWLPLKVKGNKARFIVPKEFLRKHHPHFLKNPRACMWDAIIRYGPALPTGVAVLSYHPPIYSGTWEEHLTRHYLHHGFSIKVYYASGEETSF